MDIGTTVIEEVFFFWNIFLFIKSFYFSDFWSYILGCQTNAFFANSNLMCPEDRCAINTNKPFTVSHYQTASQGMFDIQKSLLGKYWVRIFIGIHGCLKKIFFWTQNFSLEFFCIWHNFFSQQEHMLWNSKRSSSGSIGKEVNQQEKSYPTISPRAFSSLCNFALLMLIKAFPYLK